MLGQLGAAPERRALLHEMSHAAVLFLWGGESEDHGPLFLDELERLYALGETWAGSEMTRCWPAILDRM